MMWPKWSILVYDVYQSCIKITNKRYCVILYRMDRVSDCSISVIQQDTQYLMINFIHNIALW
jgi:hypothetical protein